MGTSTGSQVIVRPELQVVLLQEFRLERNQILLIHRKTIKQNHSDWVKQIHRLRKSVFYLKCKLFIYFCSFDLIAALCLLFLHKIVFTPSLYSRCWAKWEWRNEFWIWTSCRSVKTHLILSWYIFLDNKLLTHFGWLIWINGVTNWLLVIDSALLFVSASSQRLSGSDQF